MSKTLIIAEKPSVASDIASALGGFTKMDSGWERADLIVGHARGHLVGIDAPEFQERTYDLTKLPIIPLKFSLEIDKESASVYQKLKKLMDRADVTTVINACDAGREGELIFRYIVAKANCRKPMLRMWLQSMTEGSIKDAFAARAPLSKYDALADAAMCRSEADLIVGINGSRGVTYFRGREIGGFESCAVGRVMTPTLALVVRREREITNFKSRDYCEVHASFEIASGQYAAKWMRPPTATDDAAGNMADAEQKHRVATQAEANDLIAKCRGSDPTSIVDVSRPASVAASKLFDLTALQREANEKLGFSAAKTLELAQALYDRKLLTYPRTDANALPEDYADTARRVLNSLRPLYGEHAKIAEGRVDPNNKRIFDNSKISDHFAITPTGEIPTSLSGDERALYDMVAKRFIAAFHPSAEYLKTTRTTIVAGEHFIGHGSVLTSAGWLSIYGKDASAADGTLVPLSAGERGRTVDVIRKDLKTKPPLRYTEATLLAAMEGAGKFVEDEALREAMKERGLGTPATRAATIEKLLKKTKSAEAYMRRETKYLAPNEHADKVIGVLETIGAKLLTEADTTGEWESKLLLMQKGDYPRPKFMSEIGAAVTDLIFKISQRASILPPVTAKTSGSSATPSEMVDCPSCHKQTLRRIKGTYGFFWGCSDRDHCGHSMNDDKGKPVPKAVKAASSAPAGPKHKAGEACPKCGSGTLQERKFGGGDGKAFLGCSRYGSRGGSTGCDFFAWP